MLEDPGPEPEEDEEIHGDGPPEPISVGSATTRDRPAPSPEHAVPADSMEGRFRLAAARVLDERAAQLVQQAKGALDVSEPGPAGTLWLGARRMRAALEFFRPCISKSDYRASREEVTRLGRAAGARRDVDAVISLCEAVAAEMGPLEAEGVNRAVDRLRRNQAELNRDLARHIHGRRLQAFKVRTEDLAGYATREVVGERDEAVSHLIEPPEPVIRLVSRRLERLRDLAPAALDPENVREHHRMRVAAERLRYALELSAEALGSQAHTARRAARGLQETLGDVRDCDLVVDPIRSAIAELEEEDIAVVLDRARGSRDLDPVLVQAAPNRAAYRGPELVLVHAGARRRMMFERFRRLWLEQSRQGVWVALETGLRK